MNKLKLYIAGKVSPNSVFKKHDWRDEFCAKLAELSNFEIINLDPTKSHNDFDLDENNSKLIFGRDCFMINLADLVLVNLTDDISVGGSQEMLIAKYYNKPLVGIVQKNGKFFKEEIEILGKTYKNWLHPFVSITCDAVVEDINGAAEFIKNFFIKSNNYVKDISILDEYLEYYKKQYYEKDNFFHNL